MLSCTTPMGAAFIIVEKSLKLFYSLKNIASFCKVMLVNSVFYKLFKSFTCICLNTVSGKNIVSLSFWYFFCLVFFYEYCLSTFLYNTEDVLLVPLACLTLKRLIYFRSVFPSYTPCKCQKTSGLLMFSWCFHGI